MENHIEFKLSKGKSCKVDLDDYENIVKDRKWCANIVKKPSGKIFIYARTNVKIDGKYTTFSLHRMIMGSPKGLCVDHINGDTLDCRKINLRVCTYQENGLNRVNRSKNYSEYPGITFQRGEWVAQYKQKKIGAYKTEKEAYEAYKEVALINGIRKEFLSGNGSNL